MLYPNKSIEISEIISFLDAFLHADEFTDHCSNGLQIQGSPASNGIIAGVSISLSLIEYAISKKINTLLVHHGLIWKNTPLLSLKGSMRKRLKVILENDINLIGYHLPLDANPDIGNNISIIRMLGDPAVIKPFDVGFIAIYDPPLGEDHIKRILHEKGLCQACYQLNRASFRTIAAVSGGSSHLYEKAWENGCDLFITGEIKEPTYRLIDELGTGYIAMGHYNSETFGIRNLCRVISEKFGLYAEFADIPNPY